MTIYERVKAAVTIRQAAEHHGLTVSRNGMACCPFHRDLHPSMKLNEDYFFCFGCGAKGDVIDLVARLDGLSGYEAAQKLADDFGSAPSLGGLWWLPASPNAPISDSSGRMKCCVFVY